jgi:molecular chaperone DnaJ
MTVFVPGFGSRSLPYRFNANIRAKSRNLQSRAAARQADYYQVLELERFATDTDIKAAYRRLARIWHPDVSAAPDAATVFQNLTRAFETLSDEERRAHYDRNLAYKEGFDEDVNAASRKSSSDVHSILSLSLQKAVLGGLHRVTIRSLLSQCSLCRGSGGAPGGRSDKCQVCRGRGDIFKTKNNSTTGQTSTSLIRCPACYGRGLLIIDCCPKCNGNGLSRIAREIELRVPPGVDNGTILKVPGQGDVREDGGKSSGGLKGDLFIQIEVLPSKYVQRIGMDLYSEVRIPLFMAILGGKIQVETLARGEKTLEVPPGTAHGAQLSLAKEGVLGKGSHHYKVKIEVPRELNEEETELIRKLAHYTAGGATMEK